MRAGKIVQKNLIILMRSKGSALVVLLAPLLIVLVIGISFTTKVETKLDIGIYAPDESELTQRFISNLNTSQHNLKIYESSDKCVQSIKEGVTLACIMFPENFIIENNRINEVKFYVDDSRVNLVYQLQQLVGGSIDVEKTEVSQEITQQLLSIMDNTSSETKESLATIVAMKAKLKTSSNITQRGSAQLTSLDLNDESVNFSAVIDDIQGLSEDYGMLKIDAYNVAVDAKEMLNILEDDAAYNSSAERLELEESVDDLNQTLRESNATASALDAIIVALLDTGESVTKLQEKLEKGRIAKTSVTNDLKTLKDEIAALETAADSIKRRQESIQSQISSFKITNAASIVNPIQTTIEPVSAKYSKITYSFPYLLMLVILFVGIMLSSTLIFMEKQSRAKFRNFTTPIPQWYFNWMTYVTSLLIIFVQIIAVLVLVNFGLDVPIFNNIAITALMIFLGVNVFVLLGMFIGQLFNTSEAITMSTISIGAVLIFISNLILPIETLSQVIQNIAVFNPYVITSESIRKAMLFGSGLDHLYPQAIMLTAYSAILLVFVWVTRRIQTSKFVMGTGFHKAVAVAAEDSYLEISKGTKIKDEQELLEALRKMTDEEYDKLTKPKNQISDWAKNALKEKRLAGKLEKATRDKAIKAVEKHINKR